MTDINTNSSIENSKTDKTSNDKDFDNLIFGSEENDDENSNKKENNDINDKDRKSSQNSMEEDDITSRPSSSSGVFPMNRIKNGANNASKMFGNTFQKVKQKSSAGWGTAANAGTSLTAGFNKAVAVSSEKIGIFNKKTTSVASAAMEKTKAGANAVKMKAGTIAASISTSNKSSNNSKKSSISEDNENLNKENNSDA